MRFYGACFCLLLSFAARHISAQEAETQPTPPPYQVDREDEDWSMMRDPSRRSDWSDKLKYIPLGQREGWYVSIGGEVRPRLPFSPRPGFKANVTSGDRDPNDSDLGTFHPLFPKGAYFGQLASIAPLNHRDLHPKIDLTFPHGVSFTGDWVFYWRQSLRDGVYSVPGDLLRTGQLSRARFTGHQPDFELRWLADRHTTFFLNYGRFFVGRFLRETPPGKNTTFIAAWMTYMF